MCMGYKMVYNTPYFRIYFEHYYTTLHKIYKGIMEETETILVIKKYLKGIECHFGACTIQVSI